MTPTATEIGVWILVATALIPTAKIIVDWIRPAPRRIEPQPVAIKVEEDVMTSEMCKDMHAQIQRFEDQRFSAIESRLSELVASLERRNQDGESRASKIHQRIDGVVEAVSELRGKVDTHISQHKVNS